MRLLLTAFIVCASFVAWANAPEIRSYWQRQFRNLTHAWRDVTRSLP